MVPLSIAALVDLLGRHQLLPTERLLEVQSWSTRFASARELAQELIRRDWLTPFQVNQLFLDRGAELVIGQFVLLDRIGEGGMGQVFKAWQRNLQRIVALKLIRKECLENPRLVQRFQREIRAAGQLAHPHIVHAYDAGQENGAHFIAMEYVEGVDLAHLVEQAGPLAVPQACDYLRQAALGLQHAFENGLIHRDLKPANLLVTSGKSPTSGILRRPGAANGAGSGLIPRPPSGLLQRPPSGLIPRPGSGLQPRPGSGLLVRPGGFPWGIVKILDLGLARWIDPQDGLEAGQVTQLGAFMGTPDFIAPEQALDSQESDIRSDMYSLGCTFYYLLSGEVPFPDGSLTDKIIRHQNEEPEPVERVRHRHLILRAESTAEHVESQVPISVACLVRRLMAKRPLDRVQTPGELADLLQEIQDNPGQPSIPALPMPRPAPLARSTVIDEPPGNGMPRRPPLAKSSAAANMATVVKIDPPPPVAPPPVVPPPAAPASAPAILLLDKPAKRRRYMPVIMVVVAVVIGMFAAVLGGQGHRPQASSNNSRDEPLSAAEVQWRELQERVRDKKVDPDDSRADLARFRARQPGGPHAREATALLMQLPSALDRLDWQRLGQEASDTAQPAELVGVLGAGAGPVRTVAFSPDGRFLLAGSDREARLWHTSALDVPSGRIPYKLTPHAFLLSRLAFAPEGRYFASAGLDGTCKIWDTKVPGLVREWKESGEAVTGLAYSPDGVLLAAGGRDGKVRVWEAAGGKLRFDIAAQVGKVLCLAFTPDGRFLFWGGDRHRVRWLDLAAGQPAHDDLYDQPTAWISVLAFHPDGKHVILGGGGDGTLHLCHWDGRRLGLRQLLSHHRGFVNDLCYSPDGASFVSVSNDRTIKLCHGATGALLKSWDTRVIPKSAAFAPDGRHFAVGNSPGPQDGSVFLFKTPAANVAPQN